MFLQRAIAVAAALLALLAPARALASQEGHETGGDVSVRVEPNGVASVEQTLRWHVARGPLRTLDVVGIDPAAVIEPEVPVAAEDGQPRMAHAARKDDQTVRITVDDPHATAHDFSFALHWRLDLAATRALARDGGSWRLSWSSPLAADGVDVVHTVFDLPAAPDAPQPIVAGTGAVDDGAVASLRREPGRDVLELVRPHVSRGESVTWTVRLDPRALPQVTSPHLRPPVDSKAGAEPSRVREVSFVVALAALAVGFGFLVRQRGRAFAQASAGRAAEGARAAMRSAAGASQARGLLPLPQDARALLAGIALAAGVGLQIAGNATGGAACVALSMLAAAMRAPAARPVARGPGRWLALRPEEAFAADIAAGLGPRVAFACAALVLAAALLARAFDTQAAWLLMLDATALVPLLATGRASQLPPHGARSAAPWLSRAFRALKAMPMLRVAPWGRVTGDGSASASAAVTSAKSLGIDELRLLVLPRVAMPGVVGVEIGLAWSSTPVGWTATPEVFARVLDGSAAAAKLARDLPGTRVVPGRRPDERVMRLLPRAPTRAGAIALVRGLADALTDRRGVSAKPWTEAERRQRRPARGSGAASHGHGHGHDAEALAQPKPAAAAA